MQPNNPIYEGPRLPGQQVEAANQPNPNAPVANNVAAPINVPVLAAQINFPVAALAQNNAADQQIVLEANQPDPNAPVAINVAAPINAPIPAAQINVPVAAPAQIADQQIVEEVLGEEDQVL